MIELQNMELKITETIHRLLPKRKWYQIRKEYETYNIDYSISCKESDITVVEQILDEGGELDTTRCKVNISSIGDIVVNHSYDEMKQIFNNKNIKGFYNGN